MKNTVKNIFVIGISAIALSACGSAERIANIGKAPDLSPVADKEIARSQQPVSLPMPQQRIEKAQANSLWTSGRTTFFEDQRANKIGDILTVVISIDEEAEIENETSRRRSSGEDAGLNTLLGFEQYLDDFLPEGVNGPNLTDFDTSSNFQGSGDIEREEEVNVRVAAMVSQQLPNGNFVIHGRQELLVNFEKRILQVDGVIRPEDISTENSINYDQIAQARIVYGGEGHISDVQQPRYGQQLYDVIFPF